MDALRVLVLMCLACGGAVVAQVYAEGAWNASREMRCFLPAAPERPASPRNATTGSRRRPPSAQTAGDRCWRVAPLLPPQTAAAASRRLAGDSALPGWPSDGRIAALLVWLRDSGWPAGLFKALKAAHDCIGWCVKAVLPEPTYIRRIEDWMRVSLVPKMRRGALYVRGLINSYDREKAALYMRTTIEKGIQRYKEAREETIKWVEESKIIEYSVMLFLTVMTHATLVWIAIKTI